MYRKNLVFIAACSGMLLFGIVMITLGSILPELTVAFGFTTLSAGELLALLPLGILAGSLIFGPIVDRFGFKYVLIACALLILAGLELLVLSESVYLLNISVILIGLGGGAINGSANALVSDIFEKNKGAALSLLGMFYGIGALSMPALIGFLSGIFSYHLIIRFTGIFIFLFVLFYILIRFPEPKNKQSLPISAGLKLLKELPVWVFGFILFLESGIEGILSNWTTLFLQTEIKINPENSLFALSFFVVGMSVCRLFLGGFILKRINPFPVIIFSVIGSLAGVLVIIFSHNYFTAATGTFLLGAGCAAVFPVMLGMIGQLYKEMSGTAFSIILVIALLGNMFMNYSFGLISGFWGLSHFTTFLITGLLIMLLIMLFFRKITFGSIENLK